MKKLTIENKLISGLFAALALLLISGGLMYRSLQRYIETSHEVTRTYQVLDALGDVRSGLREMESEQRSYLITSEGFTRNARAIEIGKIREILARVGALTADNPKQQLRSVTLAKLAEERIQLLDGIVTIYRNQGFDDARDTMKTGSSRSGMDVMLKHLKVMEDEERLLLMLRNDAVESNAVSAKLVGTLLVGLALAGLLLLWWRIRSEERQRQATETAVHESEFLKQILNLLPVGVIVTDASGKIIQINPAAREIWGVAHYADNSEPLAEYEGWWPETGKRLAADEWALARTLKTGETVRDELVDIRSSDGVRKTIYTSAMPIRNSAGRIVSGLTVNVDVTIFKRTEKLLRAAASFDETQGNAVALFSASFDRRKILDGLLALLAGRHPLPVSALYGFDEWSGRYHCEAAHGLGEDMPREFALGDGMLGQAAETGETTVLNCATLTLKTGVADFAPALVLMIPVSYQGRRIAVLVLAASRELDAGDRGFLDRLAVTLGVALDNLRQYDDLRALAEKLRANSEEIALKNHQLEEAGRMKSEFLANMSHELRTPLNAIIGFSEVLKDGLMGALSKQQSESVNDIFTSGIHLLSLINDILDLSKVEAGKMTLELEPLEPSALVQSGLQVVREKAMAHRLGLTSEVAEGLGDIWLDERKVKQIIYNLLSNAVKFTPEGGSVHVAARRVGRDVMPQGDFDHYLELTVRDTGIGISAEDQKQLFTPFTQIDSKLSRRYAGTGLGLAMVKRLAELHGGKVVLQSAPGAGSTFTVWLPWRLEGHALATGLTAAAPVRDVMAGVLTPLPVVAGIQPLALVVEEDDKAATLMRLQLENSGFRVVRTVTAESALELAVAECPDLITLDIELPGMNGWDFLEQLKQHPACASVPVVIVSIVADRIRGLSLGANQVLQKPVSSQELASALAALGFKEGERRTVLVVDDDPKAVQLLCAYLDPIGYRVLSAFGGQEGIEVARRQPPDLLVLDLMMPEISGFDVVEALKRDAATANIPIIVVTAKQVTEDDRKRLNGDVLKVIEKSEFKHVTFVEEVKRAMSGKVK
ncbi:MAG: response regulator [Fluviicoccus sp.]|uniref:response regulator n=1 Tax=Fluviicoccus sp. TaxID=2003552 RepID=UPI0027157130|nr:response regulator [Fluviicoccus sp.]MDO8331362.1 response regulator [Fluviicoccus sp.]